MFEDDYTDPEFELFLEYVRELQMEEERRGTIRIFNSRRMAEMENAYNLLSSLVAREGFEASIRCGISDFSGAGYITVEGDTVFVVRELKALCDALQYMSNLEVVIAHGKLQLNCMFYGVTETRLLPEEG